MNWILYIGNNQGTKKMHSVVVVVVVAAVVVVVVVEFKDHR